MEEKVTAPTDKPAQQAARALGPWTGVAVDIALTLLLIALGIDPVFSLIEANRGEAAVVLCSLHLLVAPAGFLAGLWRSDELDLFDSKTRAGKLTGAAFLTFYIAGWALPLAVKAVSSSVPDGLFMACVFSHGAPIFLIVLLALIGLDKQADRFVAALNGRRGTRAMALLFSTYLAGVEVFLLLLRESSRGGSSKMALPIWAISYLPTRLLLARLTGLKGPERWTFALSNIHLLVRLLLAGHE